MSRRIPEFRYADETEVSAAQLMTPEWANFSGNVHGGSVLRLVDDIAYVCAMRYAATVCVTAAVDRVDFHEPIHVGNLLRLSARICYAGRTSMEVEITIFAEDIPTSNFRHTNTCYLTMVALEDGKPVAIPRLICRTRDDKARAIQARMRRTLGQRYREERTHFQEQYQAMDDAALEAEIAKY